MVDWNKKPSVYTPFFRRFTDERTLEMEETKALYDRVLVSHQAFKYTPLDIGAVVYEEFEHTSPDIRHPMCQKLDELIKMETYIFDMPAWDPNLNLKEWTDLRTFLRRKEYFFANQDKVLQLLVEGLARIFGGLGDVLPQTESPSPFTIPLIYALPGPRLLIDKIYGTLIEDQYSDRGLFRKVGDQLYQKLCEASGRVPYEESKRPFKSVIDSILPLNEITRVYLGGTPFETLFDAPVPLKLTHDDRFNHMHIVGGTGAGKTTLLENLILHDLNSDDPPCLIIVDSQGDLIRKLSHLALFDPSGALGDRFVFITPKDIQHPPALNIFDVHRDRLDSYDEVTKEQVTAGVIQTFDYVFTGLLGADLSAKQGVFFKFIARLMLSLPETMGRNATILDMMKLMEEPEPYLPAINSLPPIPRDFFQKDFLGAKNTFKQTREQVRYRLQAIIENPTMARLFTTPDTRVDLFTEMNKGSIILVDTAKDFLKGSSAHFGQIFISLVLQATQERAALAEHERRPAFLIVDEAASYFDSNIDDLLTDARKYKLGCVFAHQYLEQATSALRASLAANTSIKFASGVSNSDAKAMATDMRTAPDFILNQPRLQFAAHMRNVTPNAVSIPVKVGQLEREPQLDAKSYSAMIERNREKVSSRQAAKVDTTPLVSTPDLGTETADEW